MRYTAANACFGGLAMSVAANKDAVRRFFAALDAGDAAAGAELLTQDCVRHFPGRDLSGEAARAGRSPASAFKTTMHDLIGEGDRVVARITHEVTFESAIATRIGHVPAAGQSVAWDATVVFRFENSKIAEEWVSRDELSILWQLNAIAAPAR